MKSKVIDNNPTIYLTAKGGGVPQKEKAELTDEQVGKLLEAIQGLLPFLFIMIGLYSGLRREEALAVQWNCVFLDAPTPYISVRRAWRSEHNRPVISAVLKTPAAKRAFWNVNMPGCDEHYLVHRLLRKSVYVPDIWTIVRGTGNAARRNWWGYISQIHRNWHWQ